MKSFFILVVALLCWGSCSSKKDSAQPTGVGAVRIIQAPDDIYTRAEHAMCSSGRKIMVWGGIGFKPIAETIEVFDQGFTYDVEKDHWLELPKDEDTPSARRNAHCAFLSDLFFIWGGQSQEGSALRTGAFWDGIPNNWTALPSLGSHTQTVDVTFAPFRDRFIVWGGGIEPIREGVIYRLEENLWSTMSQQEAPTARSFPASASSSDYIFMWGGKSGKKYLQDGALYNVERNTWQSLPKASMLSAREKASAVWTSQGFIIWGGFTAQGYANDGAIYQPGSNRWRTIARSPLAGRTGHIALWTGRYMVIWGGQSQTGARKDGAVYDVAANTWQMLSDVDLTPRIDHRAVWTGKEIVIWGGWDGQYESFGPDGNKYRNDGAVIILE